jgi:hypothetical protein
MVPMASPVLTAIVPLGPVPVLVELAMAVGMIAGLAMLALVVKALNRQRRTSAQLDRQPAWNASRALQA